MAESNGCAKALRSVTRGAALSTDSPARAPSNIRDCVATMGDYFTGIGQRGHACSLNSSTSLPGSLGVQLRKDLADTASASFQDMIATMKVCSVYFCGSDIYISSSARNTVGIYNNSEPFFKLSHSISPHELGQKVLEALDSTREGIPAKKYVKGVKQPPDPLLVFSGFRSWRAFEKGATHVSISRNDSEVQITPSVSSPKGGYLYKPDRAVCCLANPEEIGSLLLQ